MLFSILRGRSNHRFQRLPLDIEYINIILLKRLSLESRFFALSYHFHRSNTKRGEEICKKMFCYNII